MKNSNETSKVKVNKEVILARGFEETTSTLSNTKETLSKFSSCIPEFAFGIDEAKSRIQMLRNFVKEMMIPGVDYGLIPGCNKPSLFKPGAEKLCEIFGFSKLINVVHRQEDWDKGFFAYEVKATLKSKNTGIVEAEGVGSCNCKEKRYKNQDAFTLQNTILKMAKKRALIDAVLSATRSSGIFTQDVEDFIATQQQNINALEERIISEPAIMPPTKEKLNSLYNLVKELRIPTPEVKKLLLTRYCVENSTTLTANQIDDFINYLTPVKGK